MLELPIINIKGNLMNTKNSISSTVKDKLVEYVKKQYPNPYVRVYAYEYSFDGGICVDNYPSYKLHIRIREWYDPVYLDRMAKYATTLSLSDPELLSKIDKLIEEHKSIYK